MDKVIADVAIGHPQRVSFTIMLAKALDREINPMRLFALLLTRLTVAGCGTIKISSQKMVESLDQEEILFRLRRNRSRKEYLIPAIVLKYVLENWERFRREAISEYRKKRGGNTAEAVARKTSKTRNKP